MNDIERGTLNSASDSLERKPDFWEREVANQRISGKTVKEFCCERGLPLTTFQYYKYKRCNRKKRSADKKGIKELAERFIPVCVTSNDANTDAKSNDLKIALKNGHSIIVAITDLDEALCVIKKVAELPC